jgi:hypothetical protein
MRWRWIQQAQDTIVAIAHGKSEQREAMKPAANDRFRLGACDRFVLALRHYSILTWCPLAVRGAPALPGAPAPRVSLSG